MNQQLSINKIRLDMPSVIEDGIQKFFYPTDTFDFKNEINNLLIKKGFVEDVVPLEKLHQYVKLEDRSAPHIHNNVTLAFFETSEEFRKLYFEFLQYIRKNIFQQDFIFQETPNFRFHFPGRYGDMYRSKQGQYLGYHVDSLNGHPFEEINCWIPLSHSYRSNALQISQLNDGIKILKNFCNDINFNADIYHRSGWDLFFMKLNANPDYQDYVVKHCPPIKMSYGELLLFDSRCLHGTAENQEVDTRVSFDFRIIPVSLYNQMTSEYRSFGRTSRKFIKGDVFYKKSVEEL